MLSRLLLPLATAALATAGAAAAAAVDPPPLTPTSVHVDTPDHPGPQVLGADRKGRLHLLRGHPPALFRLAPDGSAEPIFEDAVEQLAAVFRPPLLSAALAPDGSRWLLLTPDDVYVAGAELERLPDPGWVALGAGWLGAPTLAVLPEIRRDHPAAHRLDLDRPPAVIELAGTTRWAHLVDDPGLEPDATQGRHAAHRVARDVLLAPSHPRGAWMAHRYAYRLARLSPSGSLVEVLTLGPDERGPRHVDDQDTLEAMHERLARKARDAGMPNAAVSVFTAKTTVTGLTEARDGRVYLTAAPGRFGPHAVLDRWNPATRQLDRLEIRLDYPGHLSLAAGRFNLWLAAAGTGQQVWRIPWSLLEDADWTPIERVWIDDVAIPRGP